MLLRSTSRIEQRRVCQTAETRFPEEASCFPEEAPRVLEETPRVPETIGRRRELRANDCSSLLRQLVQLAGVASSDVHLSKSVENDQYCN